MSAATTVTSTASTSYDDTSAVYGQTYYYWVVASGANGMSGYGGPDAGTVGCSLPAPPTTVSASDGSFGDHVHVQWAAVGDASSYDVWRSRTADSSAASKIGTVVDTQFDDYSATTGTLYYYFIATTNFCGTGSVSTATDSGFSGALYDDFSSSSGWFTFGIPTDIAGTNYDAPGTALRASVAQSNSGYRIIGWISLGQQELLPYASVGTGNYVRGKFWVYTGGQIWAPDKTQIPNLRLRVANRFAVTSILQAFHHTNSDPEANVLAQDVRPSSLATSPSLYRVDLDPVDVPTLITSGTTEGFLRAFEVFAGEPQENGFLALSESSIGFYPALPDSVSSDTLIKTYQAGPSGPGDFSTSAVTLLRLNPSSGYANDTSGPLPSASSGSFGVTLDTTVIPPDRYGAAAFDFIGGATEDSDLTRRARVEEGMQYKIRFHATSTQLSNRNAVIRFRARSIKFQWTQMLILGGAWAASVDNNYIAAQALPGIGCMNPDKIGSEDGGWYSVLLQSPLNKDIRADFDPGTPLSVSMPHLSAQDPPGVNTGPGISKSRRDIMTGVDVIDTFSTGGNYYLEQGNVTLDRIEVRKYPQVQD